MSLRYLLIASALLIALCGADVSEIKPGNIDLPFNDLLPPLEDVSSTTSSTSTTTTTLRTTRSTTTTTLATKPTKKPYYTKPTQAAKEDKVKPSAAKQDIQLLSLDLLPPFEDDAKPTEEQTQQVVNTEPSSVVKVTPPPTPKPVIRISQPTVPKPVISVPSPAASRPAVKVIQPAYSVHPAPPVVLPTQASVLASGFQSRFSNYFLTSTPRPRRGPLPTITPFPHHVRL
ncbi:extensin [Drosophila serrata]|uniref:extensin n=1 Tax=Drosophila serrata TaxID=7274 RepID=UPI000A1D1686|nr:extensin [Drosophila serrata]